MKLNNQKLTISVIIRSIIFWIIMVITMPVYTLLAYLLFFYPQKTRRKIILSWATLFTLTEKYICNANYTVIGQENLTIKGPAILASNHQSRWETMAFNMFFPSHVWIMKKELMKIPFFGWTARTLVPIAINRSSKSRAMQQVLEQGKERITEGYWIMIYPEGTRVAPNVNHPYKTGFARLAIALNIPIVPIAHNAGLLIPKSSFWIYPGMIKVVIGAPIFPKKNEQADALTLRVKTAIDNQYKYTS